MTIQQLLYFVTTVEHPTFLEAAEALHLSQSSLSKSLQRLEEEIGVKLFDRSKRAAALTPEGETFYKGAQNILKAYRSAMSDLYEMSSLLQGTIRLVTLPILSAYHLSAPLRAFASSHQGIDLVIQEMEDKRIVQELADGTCDAAITRLECLERNTCRCYTLAEDELVLVVAQSHPLAGQTAVSISALSAEPFIMMNRHISVYKLAVDACMEHGFSPNIIRTGRVESILSAIAWKEGISLLMRRDLDMFNLQGVSLVPLKEHYTSTVVLAISHQKKPGSSIQALIEYLVPKQEHTF